MKVGIFVDGDFIPSFDGASNRFHYLSRYLQRIGVDVVVFHGYRRWSDVELIKKEPFKTYFISIDSYYKDLDFVSSLVNKEGIDLIQFDNLEPILIQGAKIASRTNTRLVSEMHYCVSDLAKSLGAPASRIQEVREAEYLTGKFIDHVICLTDVDATRLTSLMNIRGDRISVIPSGVDLEEVKYKNRAGNKSIVFLGNLFFEPNERAVRKIHRFIYPELSKEGYKFSIIGDCPKYLREELESRNFIFCGTIDDLNQAFSDAVIALAPIDEGTGMRIKILNYMAAGIPVIASSQAITGLKDVENIAVEDNLKKYPKLIRELANDHGKTNLEGKNLRILAESSYGWESIANKTKDIYKKILDRPIIDKNSNLHLLNQVNAQEPVWLEEAIQKKRFYARYPEISSNCVLTQGGEIKKIR